MGSRPGAVAAEHRAARVMRVCGMGAGVWNGGANIAGVMARFRGCAAGGATGRRALRGYEGRTETPPQNSQRVLLAKRRTAAVSHRGRQRGGASREGGEPPRGCGGRPSRRLGNARMRDGRGEGGENGVLSCD